MAGGRSLWRRLGSGLTAPLRRPASTGRQGRQALFLGVAMLALGAQAAAQTAPPERPRPSILRQDENWGALRDPDLRAGPLDRLKHIPLSPSGEVFLHLGLDARISARVFDNEEWGAVPGRDGAVYTRINPHAGLVVGDRARLFVALKHGQVTGRRGPIAPPERDALDLWMGFGELGFGDLLGGTPGDALLRLGRQEYHFGAGRMISVREGPNVRASADGTHLRLKVRGWTVDGLAVRYTTTEPDIFDNRAVDGDAVQALYATGPLPGAGVLDLYLIQHDRDRSPYQQASGDEQRRTVGARWSVRSERLTMDLEGTGQFGELRTPQATLDIRAWSVASTVQYAYPERPWTPAVGLEFGATSGDQDASDTRLETFRAPKPPGRYFGQSNPLGPGNLVGMRVFGQARPTPELVLEAQVLGFWRPEGQDGLYSPGGTIVRGASGRGTSFVGWEPGVNLERRINANLTLGIRASYFVAGEVIEASGPGENISFLELTSTFSF